MFKTRYVSEILYLIACEKCVVFYQKRMHVLKGDKVFKCLNYCVERLLSIWHFSLDRGNKVLKRVDCFLLLLFVCLVRVD